MQIHASMVEYWLLRAHGVRARIVGPDIEVLRVRALAVPGAEDWGALGGVGAAVHAFAASTSASGTLYVASAVALEGLGAQRIASDLPKDDAVLVCESASVDASGLCALASEACIYLKGWDARLKDALLDSMSLDQYMALGEDVFTNPYALFNRELVIYAASAHYWEHLEPAEAGGRALAGSDGEEGSHGESSHGNDADGAGSSSKGSGDRGAAEKSAQLALRGRAAGLIPDDAAQRLVENSEYPKASSIREPFYFCFPEDDVWSYCLNVHDGDQYIARFVFHLLDNKKRLMRGEELLAQNYHKYMSELYKQSVSAYDTIRSQDDMMHVLLRGVLTGAEQPAERELASSLSFYGWQQASDYVLVKFMYFEGTVWGVASLYICRRLEQAWRNSAALSLGNSIIWIINLGATAKTGSDADFMQSVVYLMREYACKAGVSGGFEDFALVPDALYEAEKALELGQRRDPHFWYFKFCDYKYDYIASQATQRLGARRVCNEGLLALIDHDESEGTEYAQTLYVYLRNNQNAVKTAKELYLHRTTLIRRLSRMEELAGLDLADAQVVAHVLVSYKVLGWKDPGGGERSAQKEAAPNLLS